MFAGFIRYYARLNPQRVPENSIALRVSVLVSVLVAEIAILALGYYSQPDAILIPLLTAAGFYVSWRRRHLRNLGLKFVLSLLVIAVTIFFLRDLASNFYDTRLPLIRLFLYLQVLHSFDVPARRDLKFSLASGLILTAAGAVLATGMLYLAGMALFSIAAAVSLVFFHISEQSAGVDISLPARTRNVITYGAAMWLLIMLMAVPVFLMLPQGSRAHLQALPLSDLHRFLGDFSGDIVNPFYPQNSNPFSGPPQFNPNAYFGFQQYMDLRSRGNLSDDIVMKVKADDYDYYRGVVFDVYNGKGWEIGDEETREVQADNQPIDLNLPDQPYPRGRSQVETFYIESDLPNIIFTSWKPLSLFFPSDRVKIDNFDSLRSPTALTEGTVYSAIVEQPAIPAETLRKYPRLSDKDPAAELLRLPDNDDISRIQALTTSIVRPYSNRYDQVIAIETYLKENYRYDLGIPPQESSEDAVAYFLFGEKAGYCEHFSSAMAVMARSAGIPARVVTGYAGGSYNPFTGMWEVKQSDAHAWVEIYFGTMGWVSFDPTPGFATPTAGAGGRSPWIAGALFSYFGRVLSSGPVGFVLSGVAGGAGALLGFVNGLPLALIGLLALALTILTPVAIRVVRALTRERRLRRSVTATLSDDYLRQRPLCDYFEAVTQLYRQGLWRRPDETLRQFGVRASRHLGSDEFQVLSRIVEALRYREGAALETENARARELSLAVQLQAGAPRMSSSAGRQRSK